MAGVVVQQAERIDVRRELRRRLGRCLEDWSSADPPGELPRPRILAAVPDLMRWATLLPTFTKSLPTTAATRRCPRVSLARSMARRAAFYGSVLVPISSIALWMRSGMILSRDKPPPLAAPDCCRCSRDARANRRAGGRIWPISPTRSQWRRVSRLRRQSRCGRTTSGFARARSRPRFRRRAAATRCSIELSPGHDPPRASLTA